MNLVSVKLDQQQSTDIEKGTSNFRRTRYIESSFEHTFEHTFSEILNTIIERI